MPGSVGVVIESIVNRSPTRVRALAAAAFACTGLVLVLVSFALERYQPWEPAVSAVSIGLALYLAGWWKARRAVSTAILVNVLLIFGYLWSLDEQLHVTVTLQKHVYVARIGHDVARASVHPRSGRFGLTAGDLSSYRVQPTGEAFPPSNASALAWFGDWMRLVEPRPAWRDIRIGRRGRLMSLPENEIQNWNGSWGQNVRGEEEGSLGGAALFLRRGSQTSLSADLMRADGTQGVLAGIDATGTGYLLQIRMDQPDAIWIQWRDGQLLQSVGGTLLHPQFVPMMQRNVRLLLGNFIAALMVLLVALPAYVVVHWMARAVGFSIRDFDRLGLLAENSYLRRGLVIFAGLGTTIAAALVATVLLQAMPHVQDSVAYLFQAKTLALGRLDVPAPNLIPFFREEFIPFFHGRWFGKYPPGWPLLLAIGVLAHVPWIVNPVLAGIDVVLIYLIGKEVYPKHVALIATLIAFSSPFLLFLGGSFMAHTATLFFLAGFAYLVICWIRRQELGRAGADWKLLVPAGFLLGMGMITRQLDALAFAAPFVVVVAFPAVRRRARALGWCLLGGSLPLAFLLFYNWSLTGHPLTSPYSIWSPMDHPGFGKNVGWMGGFTPAQGLWNTSFNLQMLLAHLWGWPFFLTLALALLPFVLGRTNRWDWLFGASAVGIIVAYVFYWGAGVMYGPRYYYVSIPWLALLTARGLQELFAWPMRLPLRLPKDPIASLAIPTLLLIGLFAYDLTVYLPAQVPIYNGYNFASADSIDAVARARIHHALVFVVTGPFGGWWSYADTFSSNSPLLNGDIVYARDLGPSNPSLMRLYPNRSYWRLNGTKLTKL